MDNQAGALWRSYMPLRTRTLKGFLLLLATALIATACGTVDERQHIDPASPPEPIQEFQWNSQAIGYDDTSLELSGQSASKTVRLVGAGADIWGARDEFIYFYTQVEGDFQLTARLDSFDHADPWSKAGLMVRESLDPAARNSLIHTSGSSGAVLQARETLGGVTNNDGGKDPSVSAPNSWMRLTRVEGVIAGELSHDGVNWRELGRYELELASTVHIGLAVTAHEPSSVAEAVFSHLSVRDDNVQLPAPEPDPAGPEPVPTDPEPEPNDPEPEPTEPEPEPADPEPEPTDPAPRPGPVNPVAPGQAWVCGSAPLQPAYQPTYFVATNGSDSNDGRSEARPFRTLRKVSGVVQPGDVVWVRGGTYSPDVIFSRSGRAGNPIVVESYPGECAILDGAGMSRPSQLRFIGASHYVFRNFIVRNSPGQGVYLNDSHDNLISHIETYGNGLSGFQIINGNRNTFANVIAYDNYDPENGGGNADGIGISSGRDNVIDRCVVFRNSDDGIDTWRSVNTLVQRCVAFDNGFQGGDGNGIKAGGGTDARAVVRYSVAFGNRVQGFNYNSGRNVLFENNTAFDNGYWGFIAGNSVLRNNVSYSNSRGQWQDNGGNTSSSNTWSLSISNPQFVSTSPTDEYFLSPASSSPVAGRGSSSGSGHADLGALPVGETIESFLGVPLRRILGQ